jgi:hypothetical protein
LNENAVKTLTGQNKHRAVFVLTARMKRGGKKPREKNSIAVHVPLGFAHTPAILLRGFLIIGRALHVPYETFFFTELLEASDHLLH